MDFVLAPQFLQRYTCRSLLSAEMRTPAVLRRRALAADASARGLRLPSPARGITGIASVSSNGILFGMPATAYVVARPGAGNRGCKGGLRRGGGGGAGGAATKEGASGAIGRQKRSSTFWRLWKEAKKEKGHLALASVCLLLSSSMNLLAPTIVAK